MFYNVKVSAAVAAMPWEKVVAKSKHHDCDCSKLIGEPLYMIVGSRPRVRKVLGLSVVIANWQQFVPYR